jgi:DNA-binding NarL/FixJ family response regulator
VAAPNYFETMLPENESGTHPIVRSSHSEVRLIPRMGVQTKSVLIVDDNFTVRAALRTFVERNMGMQVCATAANGAEAIGKAREYQPDLVLMDLGMPVMNGLDAASAIKKATPNSRIVIFTLYSDTLGKLLASGAGIDLVISKSDGPDALLHGLECLFDLPARNAPRTEGSLSESVACGPGND